MFALLAERDTDTRSMYAEYLRQATVEIDEAADGRLAFAKALVRPHDVVITETRLPEIDGYELCAMLRREDVTRSTPIVVVTADAYQTDLDRARTAGADVVLAKPCLPSVLLEELRRLVGRSRELRARGDDLRSKLNARVAQSNEIIARIDAQRRSRLERFVGRDYTTTPPEAPRFFTCPRCNQPLLYQRSHLSGGNPHEQWDYYACSDGCGTFQFRQKTDRLRRISTDNLW